MAARGWPGASAWAERANDIAPTIVGGSKKHGGADLGPTRAKRAWREMGVDALGVADAAPSADDPMTLLPKLTCEMVARLQGWNDAEYRWTFTGRKTSTYRQIGNAFPPPVAEAVGTAIRRALEHAGAPGLDADEAPVHDPVLQVLRSRDDFLTAGQIADLANDLTPGAVLGRLGHLGRDFDLEVAEGRDGPAYRLGGFKAFLGQREHARHRRFAASRATIS